MITDIKQLYHQVKVQNEGVGSHNCYCIGPCIVENSRHLMDVVLKEPYKKESPSKAGEQRSLPYQELNKLGECNDMPSFFHSLTLYLKRTSKGKKEQKLVVGQSLLVVKNSSDVYDDGSLLNFRIHDESTCIS